MCQPNLSKLCLIKTIINWLRIIKRAIIFGFVIVPTQCRLSFQKYPIDDIAQICQVHRTTVGIWIDNWNEFGSTGLEDGERTGRPPILTLEEQAQAFATAIKNPKFPHRQLGEIKRETGKEISQWTLKRLVKKKTISGKESCFGLWKQTDADEKEFAKQDAGAG